MLERVWSRPPNPVCVVAACLSGDLGEHDGHCYPHRSTTVKWTVRDLDLTKLAISSEQGMVRSEGVHVSTVLRYIKTTIGGEASDFSEDDLEWFAVVGRLWEHTLSRILYPEPRYCRIGELDRDGIIGSPDNLDLEFNQFGEFKVTWQSSRGFTERMKFREYLWQIKAYIALGIPLFGEQTEYVAWLDVFHVCGDYRPPKPNAVHYDLRFTHGEIREHWNMMKVNAEYVRGNIGKPK